MSTHVRSSIYNLLVVQLLGNGSGILSFICDGAKYIQETFSKTSPIAMKKWLTIVIHGI